MLKLSPRILLLFVSLTILTNQLIVSSATLKCEFIHSSGWTGVDENIYFCYVEDNGIFIGDRVIINSTEGEHAKRQSNANVQGLNFYSIPNVKFFPQNIEDVFSNLILINFYSTGLQKIKQSDLKKFPRLKSLKIYSNEITKIDEDLFKFNHELSAILLHNNKISHIDPKVFDRLDNLVYLWLDGNQCRNDLGRADDSRSDVLDIVERVRDGECVVIDKL